MKNIFDQTDAAAVISRINNLTPATTPIWGKMSVSQMLAHCNVTYEMVYEDIHPRSSFFMKFILKTFVKEAVVGDKPYKKNGPTAPAFLIKDERDFETEKARLSEHINKTQLLGQAHFTDKESHGFGVLTLKEWNTMFYKHLDHHLSQFGV